MKSRFQRLLLGGYAAVARTGALDAGPGRRAFEAAYLGYKRFVEAGAVARLRRHVAPGSTVIDVGANIGYFTRAFAEWVGPEGRVLAVEPEPRNVASLRRRLRKAGLDGRVEVLEGVAAERSGAFRLAVNPTHPGDHKLSEDGVEVQGWSIDDLIDQRPGRRVSFIKIDVQGAEDQVIAGAERLLARDLPTLLVEIDAAAMAAMGQSAEALLAKIAAFGYEGRVWSRTGTGKILSVDQQLQAAQLAGYVDILFQAKRKIT